MNKARRFAPHPIEEVGPIVELEVGLAPGDLPELVQPPGGVAFALGRAYVPISSPCLASLAAAIPSSLVVGL